MTNSSNQEPYSLNFPMLIQILNKWKGKLAMFLVALAIVSAIILLLKPNMYYSYATAMPTNSSLNDKGYLFNDKLDQLYSSLGSYSDLDRIYATANLDTSYKYLIDKFNLVERYGIKGKNKNIAVQKTLLYMSDEILKVEKTESGLLRVHVLDENPDTAASMANTLVDYVNDVNNQLQVEYNKNSLMKIKESIQDASQSYQLLVDSTRNNGSVLVEKSLQAKIKEIEDLEKIKHQFELTLKFQQPSLRVVEKATPSYKHFKPKRIFSFISTMILGFFAALTIVIILETVSFYKKS